jgi:hypothetical protein
VDREVPAGRNIVRRPTVPAICVGRVARGTSRSPPLAVQEQFEGLATEGVSSTW